MVFDVCCPQIVNVQGRLYRVQQGSQHATNSRSFSSKGNESDLCQTEDDDELDPCDQTDIEEVI